MECIQFRNAFRLELVLAGHSEDYLFIPIKTPQVGGQSAGLSQAGRELAGLIAVTPEHLRRRLLKELHA